MKITYPHMGNVNILIEDLLGRLGVEAHTPPRTTVRTIEIGVRYSPELACFPLKVTLGNFIEGFETGADAGIMVGGVGPCRFGYYAETHRRILRQLGYDAPMFILEPPTAHPLKFFKTFKKLLPDKTLFDLYRALRISWKKAVYIEMLEKKALQTRCYEKKKGETTRIKNRGIKLLADAYLESEIEKAFQEAMGLFEDIQKEEREVARIGIVGEFYIVLEPFVNFDCEVILGEMGFYIERGIYLTDWINPSSKNMISGHSKEDVASASYPYLSHFVGGDGRQTIGHTIIYASEGFDGILHLMPFTCMPELIAKSILPRISREFNLPILTLVIDEQTGKAGIQTRLEAFADLIAARRREGIVPDSFKIDWLDRVKPELVGVNKR